MPRRISHSFPDGVSVTYHKRKRDADKEFEQEVKRKRDVSRSTSYFLDPFDGKQGRLHVVTSRPPSEWQKYARREGYGVR